MSTLRVAVVGASGYSGEELVRIVARHPKLSLTALTSRAFAGQRAEAVVSGLSNPGAVDKGYGSLAFEDLGPEEIGSRADVFFLALPHGVASEFALPLRKAGKIVFDLSADFRVRDLSVYREFYGHEHPAPALLQEAVYGLPELHRDAIRRADLVACPGCYPTSILLALAPALRHDLIDPASIVIHSMSGVSGAGKKAEVSLLFVELNETMKAYGAPKHRHLGEIEQELGLLAKQPVRVTFVPHLVPLSRGMHSTITAHLARPLAESVITELYAAFFVDEPFVQVNTDGSFPEVRHVVRTNQARLSVRVDERTGRLLLFSAIDNLTKGAAGQAVQAMNARFGYPETTGLV
jgi:N-acetyl-gamma-glutamyl-phosphate reductase